MSKLGISSACFYPLTTEESFLKLCKNSVNNIELFLNSPSELSNNYLCELKQIKDYYNITIPSLHPFMSFAESFYLFSSYERRFYDILDFYKKNFEAMNLLDIKYFIIHGAKIPGSISDEEYFSRFKKLIDIGKKFGISVLQENVVHYRSECPVFLENMKNFIGNDFGVVLDIKQSRRAGFNDIEFIDKLGQSIKHIHISDYNADSSCIVPLIGNYNFELLFNKMKDIGYNGYYIIELYNHSYENTQDIYNSYNELNKMLIDY